MTALGFLYPGHQAADDYPRIEQLLASDIRLDLVHTGAPEASARQLAEGVEELRLAGAEAVVWASTRGSFAHGRDEAHERVRTLARAAGMPASATSFAFLQAVREIGARRVAVAAPYPQDMAALFAGFLQAADIEVVSVRGAGGAGATEAADWGAKEVLALAQEGDHTAADAVLIPGTGLHTVAHLVALESELAKPVLTANQVTVWEGLRLVDRRVNAPNLGSLFSREPIVQV
ncbi:maleate cis-trans isomerase family protein [Streptomyces nodosus]|uniref:maleate cis-trans isomerase family protein n=1 Tax=Streptomyces nodosus TaxID=40318 RepID=UPI00380199C1